MGLQCFRDQLQTVPGFALVAGLAEKTGDRDALPFPQPLDQTGVAADQNNGDTGSDFTGLTVFHLPGPVLQPETLAGNAGRCNRNLFQAGDDAGELAVIVSGNQLVASSFSLALDSGEGSVIARSRRTTR